MRDRLERLIALVAKTLDSLGIITLERFYPTMHLAWPRIVTGIAVRSKQIADLAMVGVAVGATATAGLAFAFAYWEIGVRFGLGLAGGTVSLVSQNYGGGNTDRAALAVKQSVVVATVVSIPLIATVPAFAEPMIDLLGNDPDALQYGSLYLLIVTPAFFLEVLNLIASRTYTGVGDTFTEMMTRGAGALLNIVLSALFIFGFGWGVAGAALGTTISAGIVTIVFAWGMVGRSYGRLGMQPSPVPISLTGPWLHLGLIRQLLEISAPNIARRLTGGVIVFPLLWVAATFGPVVVTAFEVGRRIRSLINSANWGLALASSSLVGQHLGDNEETEAGAYGASIIRLTTVIHCLAAVVVVIFMTPIANLFVTSPADVAQTAVFIAIGAVSAIGFGIDGASTGALVGAGDTRLPFVASLVGRYVFALPLAALGLVTPLGIVGLYLAFLLESFVPSAFNYGLFRTGRWKAISRRYRTSTDSG